jgi:hypothetical protein
MRMTIVTAYIVHSCAVFRIRLGYSFVPLFSSSYIVVRCYCRIHIIHCKVIKVDDLFSPGKELISTRSARVGLPNACRSIWCNNVQAYFSGLIKSVKGSNCCCNKWDVATDALTILPRSPTQYGPWKSHATPLDVAMPMCPINGISQVIGGSGDHRIVKDSGFSSARALVGS